jgi:hypothetical protein
MWSKKLIHFDWEVHWHTQGILIECLVFPTQWNCYHLSSKWQLSGTPETLVYHEALRKDIHFYKDSLRDETVHLFFMELNTYSWSDSKLFLKVTSQIQPNFYKSVNGKFEQEIWHTQTHTHTHTHTKWWYTDCYLVNEFLNICLLNSNVEQEQKSQNTRTPWCLPSILTVLKKDFDSRSLMLA